MLKGYNQVTGCIFIMKKILVCGGYGFIGSRLIENLVNSGWDVYTLSHRKHVSITGVTEIVYSDIEQDRIDSIVKEIKPSCTVFLATQYDNGDLDKIINVNIKLPAALMKSLCKLPKGHRNIILTDSYWSLGSTDSKGIPLDDYAAAKGAVKEFAKTYSYYESLSVINLMVYGTYGNADKRGKILDAILNAVKSKTEIKLSAGAQFLDLVHVDDICDGYLLAICFLIGNKENENGLFKTYGLNTGKPVQIKKIIDFIGIKHDITSIQLGSRQYREREIFEPLYNHPKMPGWMPKNNLEDYIENYLSENK